MAIKKREILISIVCPLFNKEPYIKSTISAVLRQTDERWELIIVDDGSTDNSLKIAKSFAEQEKRIRVIERCIYSKKRGANVCRNLGVKMSTGSHIVFLDADDKMLDYCIQQRVRSVEKYPGHMLYVFNVAYNNGANDLPYKKLAPNFVERLKFLVSRDKVRYFLVRFLKFDLPWHTSGPLWDKGFFKSIDGFNENIQRLQDPDIHIRALLNNSLKIKNLMLNTRFDILHRTNSDRVTWTEEQFLFRQLQAISDFLPGITVQIMNKELLKYLQGYLIFAETLLYRYMRKNPEKLTDSLKYLDVIYSDSITNGIITATYRYFIKMYRLCVTRHLLPLKIPGALLFLYKKVVL